MVNYFFDTYALIEMTKNNSNYIRFLDEPIVTSKFNLAEFFYIVLLEQGEAAAKKAFEKIKDSEIDVPDEILFKAMLFRFKNRKKGFSYTDCIGYMLALENNMKFLTGDNAFKDMQNVEFVK